MAEETDWYNGLVEELAKLVAEGGYSDALSRLQKQIVVRWPGFEPGSPAWKAGVLDQARLPPQNGGARGI